MNLINIIEELIQKIDNTTELFYQQKSSAGYKFLEEIIGELINLNDKFSGLQNDGFNINIDIDKLNNILSEAMAALEKRDTILLSDILNYELKELLIEYKDSLL